MYMGNLIEAVWPLWACLPGCASTAGLSGLSPRGPHALELSDAQGPGRLRPRGASPTVSAHAAWARTPEKVLVVLNSLPEQLKGEKFSPIVRWEKHRSSAEGPARWRRSAPEGTLGHALAWQPSSSRTETTQCWAYSNPW